MCCEPTVKWNNTMTSDELIDALAKERAYTEVLEISIELEVQKRLAKALADVQAKLTQAEYQMAYDEGYDDGFCKGRDNGYEWGFNDCIDGNYRGDEESGDPFGNKRNEDDRSQRSPYREKHEEMNTVSVWSRSLKR